MTASNPLDVSVVIPSHRRTRRLAMTLKALDHQSLPAQRFEIIVVDDGNEPDRIPRALEAANITHEVKVVSSGRSGVSVARNRGAQEASGRILLFLDDDTLLSRLALAAHCEAHDADCPTMAHGNIIDLVAFTAAQDGDFPCDRLDGLGGKSIALADIRELEATCRQLRTQVSFIERNAAVIAQAPERYSACLWLLCIGTNTSLRMEDFWRVGGFDVVIGSEWGGEDLELGIRMRSHKIPIRMIEAPGYHLPEARQDRCARLARVWQGIANIHGNQSLKRTADFLSGKISLCEFDALIRGSPPTEAQTIATPPTAANGRAKEDEGSPNALGDVS